MVSGHRLLIILLSLQGCALLPEGTQAGVWFRIGYEQNRSMALQWDNIPRDPDWECPVSEGKVVKTGGVPTWMKCE